MTEKKRAQRLTTEQRREQIMESAVRLILGEGVARCTLEAIASEAGISKALIYRHFNSREDLLRAVLHREYQIMASWRLGSYPESLSLEDFFRTRHPRLFAYLNERGPVIRTMLNDRSVYKLLRQDDAQRREAVLRFYLRKVEASLNISERAALLGVLLTLNAPIGAAKALRSFGIDPEEAAEMWTTFLLGGWAAVSAVENLPKASA